jgi:hypothetical protein
LSSEILAENVNEESLSTLPSTYTWALRSTSPVPFQSLALNNRRADLVI